MRIFNIRRKAKNIHFTQLFSIQRRQIWVLSVNANAFNVSTIQCIVDSISAELLFYDHKCLMSKSGIRSMYEGVYERWACGQILPCACKNVASDLGGDIDVTREILTSRPMVKTIS